MSEYTSLLMGLAVLAFVMLGLPLLRLKINVWKVKLDTDICIMATALLACMNDNDTLDYPEVDSFLNYMYGYISEAQLYGGTLSKFQCRRSLYRFVKPLIEIQRKKEMTNDATPT